MKWWYLAASWLLIMLLLAGFFHAMITMRDMEVIIIGDHEDEEKVE